MSATEAMFQYPGARRFIEQVTADLTLNNRSVALRVHRLVNAEALWTEIDQSLESQGYRVEIIDISRMEYTASPITGFAKAFNLIWPHSDMPRTLQNMSTLVFPCEVIGLTGWEYLEAERFRKWYAFVEEWVQMRTVRSVHGRMNDRVVSLPRLCLLVPPCASSDLISETSLALVVRWWWGFLYGAETQWVSHGINFGIDLEVRERWWQNIIPSLAAGDPDLANFLREQPDDALTECRKPLTEYARMLGWDQANKALSNVAAFHSTSPFAISISKPPENLKPLWDEGMIYMTQIYGVELHSALVAVLGDMKELQHRIWRGQVGLVLPMVNDIRRRMCQYMTACHSEGWQTRWSTPKDNAELNRIANDASACDIGYLAHLFQNPDVDIPMRARMDLLNLARITANIRNSIAHYDVITLPQYEQMIQAFKQSPVCHNRLRQIPIRESM